MGPVGVDLAGINLELKSCSKKYASAVRKQIRAAVTEAGADIVAQVRREASWSTRIPAATTIRPNFTARSAGIRIVTNRRKAPHARPLEFGNKDGNPDVLENGTGGKMPTRPFFFKAIEKTDKATEQKFLDAIDKACREAGFR